MWLNDAIRRLRPRDAILPMSEIRPLNPVIRGVQLPERGWRRKIVESVLERTYRLYLWLGLAPSPTKAVPVATPTVEQKPTGRPLDRSAPTYLGRDTGAAFRLTNPRFRPLQLAAAQEIFAVLGVDQIPSAFYSVLDREHDPSQAVEIYAQSLGCDPTAVRRRHPVALERLRLFSFLQCQLEVDTGVLTSAQRVHLQSLLFWGGYGRVEELTRIYHELSRTQAIYRATSEAPIARIRETARDIQRQSARADDLLQAEVSDKFSNAVEDQRLAHALETAIHRMRRLAAVADALEMLLADHPEVLGQVRSAREQERAIRHRLDTDATADVHALVRRYERAVDAIDAWCNDHLRPMLAAEVVARTRRKTAAANPAASADAFFSRHGLGPEGTADERFERYMRRLLEREPQPTGANLAKALRDGLYWRQILGEAVANREAASNDGAV